MSPQSWRIPPQYSIMLIYQRHFSFKYTTNILLTSTLLQKVLSGGGKYLARVKKLNNMYLFAGFTLKADHHIRVSSTYTIQFNTILLRLSLCGMYASGELMSPISLKAMKSVECWATFQWQIE